MRQGLNNYLITLKLLPLLIPFAFITRTLYLPFLSLGTLHLIFPLRQSLIRANFLCLPLNSTLQEEFLRPNFFPLIVMILLRFPSEGRKDLIYGCKDVEVLTRLE